MTQRELDKRRAGYQDALVASFSDRYRGMASRAAASLASRLPSVLDVKDGIVQPTLRSISALRSVGKMYRTELDRLGYPSLVSTFTSQFPNQLPIIQDSFQLMSERLKQPLPPIRFTPDDLKLTVNFRHSVDSALTNIPTDLSIKATSQVLFSFGGLRLSDLVTMVHQLVEKKSLPQARTLADTALSMFYRHVQSRAYRHIEDETPDLEYLYKYTGPDDKLTRPFCRHTLASGRELTREQIESLDNGQIPNPFLSGGGFNCRHQWSITGYHLRAALPSARAILGGNLEVYDPESDQTKRHLRELDFIDVDVLRAVADWGVTVKVGNRTVTEFPGMQMGEGVKPRGWPEGTDWSQVAAGYDPDRRIVVAGRGEGTSGSLVAHELAHAVTDMLDLARSRLAKAKYDKFYENLDTYMKQTGIAGVEEFVEESMAEAVALTRKKLGNAFLARDEFTKKYDREWADFVFNLYIRRDLQKARPTRV